MRCWRRAALGRPGRPDLPRRQPAHQAARLLGVAHRPGAGAPSGGGLPGRGVHAPEGDAGAREDRIQPVLYVLYVAQLQGRAHRVLRGADAAPRWPSTSAATSSRTPPTSCRRSCSAAARRPSGCARPSRPRSARSGASTAASSCARREAVPGTEEYRHSEKYEIRVRDWDSPGHLTDYIARLNAIRRENPALQADAQSPLLRRRTARTCSSTARRRRAGTMSSWSR